MYLTGVRDCQFFFRLVGSIWILFLKVVKAKLNITYKDVALQIIYTIIPVS